MIDFFAGCTTTAEIKSRYRDLCRTHHPDLGGDTRTMQDLNAAYDAACKAAQRGERPGKSEGAYDWYANADVLVREAIAKIISLPDLDIEICGWWVWVGGDTKPVKDHLKTAGYRWSNQKARWYFKGCESSSRGGYSMDDIRATYGSQRVEGKRSQDTQPRRIERDDRAARS